MYLHGLQIKWEIKKKEKRIIYQQLWGYKVEEKIHLVVREQKKNV
jgi:hypothetical protein